MTFRQGPALPLTCNVGDYFVNSETGELYVGIGPDNWKWVKQDVLQLGPKMVLATAAQLPVNADLGTLAIVTSDNSLWVQFPDGWHFVKTDKP